MESLIVIVVISLFVFLLLRELFCWYLKINARNKLLIDIRSELKKTNEMLLTERLQNEDS